MMASPYKITKLTHTMHRNSLRRIRGLYLHYLYSVKRNPARIIEMFVWPAFEIILFGFLAASGKNKPAEAEAMGVIILTGIVYWNCTARVIQEAVAQFTDDFVSKNIQGILVAPVTMGELLIGVTAAALTKIAVSLAVLGGVLAFVYPSFFSTLGIHTLFWIFQLELVGVAFSYISLAIVLLFGERVSFSGWIISTILQIFSLVFYERTALPGILSTISYAVPSSYVFETIRAYQHGDPLITTGQIIALALSSTYIAVGFGLVNASFVFVKKIGTIIKS